jgi:putative ATPase
MDLPALLAAGGTQDVRFDAVVGRHALTRCADKTAVLVRLHACLRPGGRLSLAEVVPRQAQHLSALVDLTELGSDLGARLQAAEEAIYQRPDDPLVNWDVPELEAALLAAGFVLLSPGRCDRQEDERRITQAHLDRWLTVSPERERPSYARRLLCSLTAEELQRVQTCLRRQLLEQIVPWRTTLVYITAAPG